MTMTTQKDLALELREAREEGMRQAKICANIRAINKLMANLRIDLETAMKLLEIPRDERNTYRKICAARAGQKQMAK
ncbi:MAG TPA: hypothetical protein IAC31_00685 [Candidatus Faecousia intestinigallinarum]|nr:hypothetical protein [Candidatus Faecousia intestinigallinarum]